MSSSVKTYLKILMTRAGIDLKVAKEASARVDVIVMDCVHNMTVDALMYANIAKRKTLMARDVETALKKAIQKDSEVFAFVDAALASYKAAGAEGKSRSVRAGLAFPVSRIEAFMRTIASPMRLSEDVGVYVTAAVEFVATRLLSAAKDTIGNKKVLTVEHVDAALEAFDPPEWTASFLKVSRTGKEPEPLAAESS